MHNRLLAIFNLLLVTSIFISTPALADYCFIQTIDSNLFDQAQYDMNRVLNSSVEPSVKQALETRWKQLTDERKNLINLANTIYDNCLRGEVTTWHEAFYSLLATWYSAIEAFIEDAQEAREKNIVWTRLPIFAPDDSCEGLGGITLKTTKKISWTKISTSNQKIGEISPGGKPITGGITCLCVWNPTHEITETLCRRTVDEEAKIDGVKVKRSITIEDTLIHRQPVIMEKQVTSGQIIGTGQCLCDPPSNGPRHLR